MRKFLVSAVLLGSAFAVATPAAAQWAPPVPQGYAYGYNNYGQTRRLDARVAQIRRDIRQLDHRKILSDREGERLQRQAQNLQYRIRAMGQNGLSSRERYDIERQIANLEQRIRYEARDGNRYGNNGYNGYNNGYGYNPYDRDRDGRVDRYEDDRGRDHDGRWDR